MKNQSRLLVSLIAVALALQGCANAGATKVDAAPVAVVSKAVEPVAAPVTVAEATAKLSVETVKLPDSYTVVAGDTLAKVAARKDVYGNARLWPLLYRSNASIIGIQGLIYPGQVLAINRSYTSAEADAIVGASKSVKKPTSLATIPLPKLAAAPVPAKPVSAEIATAPVSSVPPTPAVPAPDYVSAARRAFAAGDIPWAVYYYNMHLTQRSNDVRAWGELGNVYYFDGQLSESAQAYFNAANLMIDQGRARAAGQLLPAINEGNPMLAQALYGRLATLK